VSTLAALAALPAAAAAQSAEDTRIAQNAWYWGAYGGQTSFATSIARTNAPTIGADWMITRTRYAVNVFAEQSYFNAVSTITDFPSSAPRKVDITDMRRVGFSAMFFLPDYQQWKPWFGVGYAFNFIKAATPQGSSYNSPAARDSVFERVDRAKGQGKMFGDLGVMFSYRKWAPFVMLTIMPTKGSEDWMVNGNGFTQVWKAGVRVNLGPAISERW
jgi:hypothetical protein